MRLKAEAAVSLLATVSALKRQTSQQRLLNFLLQDDLLYK